MAHNITIYTDGAARGNPGPGGYGIVMLSGEYSKKFNKGFRKTTNNRMELLAIVEALKKLKFENCDITIYSDSKYVIDAVEKKWLDSWIKTDFKKKKNKDIWLEYHKVAQKHNIKFVWVKGHSGNKYNEICDQLAVKASYNPEPLIDEGYESGLYN